MTRVVLESNASRTHGTRSCYVNGCRCTECRAANNRRYRERVALRQSMAGDVAPSGPPISSTMIRGGREYNVKRCPGANGAPCLASPPAWLRNGKVPVCALCVERATVYDGRVGPERARAHLLALRDVGVGYKAVAAASDIGGSVLTKILAGDATTIRASTERRILAVDAGARADHAVVAGARTNRLIRGMLRKGFTRRHLAKLLGYESPALQLGLKRRCLAITEARVVRLAAKVKAGTVTPERVLQAATEERKWIAELVDAGVPKKWLSKRLGFLVDRQRTATARMRPENVEKVRAFRAELERHLREGDCLPDDWRTSARGLSGIGSAFGFGGGYLIRGKLGRTAAR